MVTAIMEVSVLQATYFHIPQIGVKTDFFKQKWSTSIIFQVKSCKKYWVCCRIPDLVLFQQVLRPLCIVLKTLVIFEPKVSYMVGKLKKGGFFWCKARIFWDYHLGYRIFLNTLGLESPLQLRPRLKPPEMLISQKRNIYCI